LVFFYDIWIFVDGTLFNKVIRH